jgi:uncharacterized protein YjiS (DUF1127 family)
MGTTYGATGLGQAAASTRRVSSLLKRYWGVFLERRKREKLRANLYDLSDRELMDIGTTRGRSTMSPRTALSTRGASDPPNERPISGTGWMAEIGQDQTHHCRRPTSIGSLLPTPNGSASRPLYTHMAAFTARFRRPCANKRHSRVSQAE